MRVEAEGDAGCVVLCSHPCISPGIMSLSHTDKSAYEQETCTRVSLVPGVPLVFVSPNELLSELCDMADKVSFPLMRWSA